MEKQVIFESFGPIELEAHLKIKQMDLGWFGKVFGSADNAPTSICGMLIMIFAVVGSLLFLGDKEIALEYAKSYALPLSTCSLGYLFGKNR